MAALTLLELIAHFRTAALDVQEPQLWASGAITRWLNEGEQEAAIRRKLLHECVDPDICEIALVPGQKVYALSPYLFELNWVHREEDNARPIQLEQVSEEWLDRTHAGWRSNTREVLPYFIQKDTSLRLVSAPAAGGILRIEGYRLPKTPMERDGDTPEIHMAHHNQLVQWALHRAYSQPDSDGFDPKRAALSEQEFTAYFGPRPDADLRRDTRSDVPQANVCYY